MNRNFYTFYLNKTFYLVVGHNNIKFMSKHIIWNNHIRSGKHSNNLFTQAIKDIGIDRYATGFY